MHDTEVTDVDPVQPAGRRRRAKRPFDPAPFRSLFRMFRWLRAASVEALHHLFFTRSFPDQSTRTTGRMIAALIDEGYLAQMRLPYGRIVCHLTRSSLVTFEDAGIDVPETLRRPPTVEVGGFLWLLSNVRAEHVRGGFSVGRGPAAAYALRRFLLDSGPPLPRDVSDAIRANPTFRPMMVAGCDDCGFRAELWARTTACPRCKRATHPVPVDARFECVGCKAVGSRPGLHESCALLMREIDSLPVDVAWVKTGRSYDVRLLFVEHPARGLGAQLAELPLMHVGAPMVPVVLKSTDPDSRYDRKRHTWAVKGPRQQQLERTFKDRGFDTALPFSETATVVDALPDLQLHLLRSGAPAPAWECAPAWEGGAKLAGRNKQEREPVARAHVHEREDVGRELNLAKLWANEERREQAVPERDVRVAPEPVRERASGARRDDERGGGGVRRR